MKRIMTEDIRNGRKRKLTAVRDLKSSWWSDLYRLYEKKDKEDTTDDKVLKWQNWKEENANSNVQTVHGAPPGDAWSFELPDSYASSFFEDRRDYSPTDGVFDLVLTNGEEQDEEDEVDENEEEEETGQDQELTGETNDTEIVEETEETEVVEQQEPEGKEVDTRAKESTPAAVEAPDQLPAPKNQTAVPVDVT